MRSLWLYGSAVCGYGLRFSGNGYLYAAWLSKLFTAKPYGHAPAKLRFLFKNGKR